MADVADILPQLEQLDGEIDDLEDVLEPLLGSLADVAAKLPLLDKAKLYVLATYSIESMLFSALRLNSVDAKEHPVFKELTRVRQYFEKIKNIENPPQKPDMKLDKQAAIRFIRADLADNSEVNTQLTEMIAKERAKAALQARQQKGEKRKAGDPLQSTEASGEEGAEDSKAESEPAAKKSKKSKKNKDKKKSKEGKSAK
ncbi:Sas10/Utp3/C1D family-domain-containing protein [Microdochium trichocladiopsis]|uniref:Exosome complex protein n=1 Tax=Microdochium trichocladiopsis TaxID=1682393 RepID=A0A9P9BTM9_9PEZI|nr:Sas10/Utp3/C1D family-domain-containing protein [Microdochium trichocladiopsis]KAH7037122.1 Sas10/Utp3/C1D family-domain-containing protein [Microdochium trichocladiopsis]